MGKISQSAASDAAYKIAEPLQVKADALSKELRDFLVEEYIKTVPKEIMAIWETHKKWIKKENYIYVDGVGIGREYFNLGTSYVPSQGTTNLSLDSKNAAKYVKMKDVQEAAYQKYRDTAIEIEKTILALGTHKKIGQVMPNALRYLPEAKTGTSTQLVLQIQPVVDKVNCLITNQDKCIDKL
jgi:hypothetical protein